MFFLRRRIRCPPRCAMPGSVRCIACAIRC